MPVSGEMLGHGSNPPEVKNKDEVSWAKQLTTSECNKLNKNILEVVLDKDTKGAFNVSESDCAKLMQKLGLDLRAGVEVEGVQLCPNGRGIILITLKDHVKIDNYCRYDVLEVTHSGIRTSIIKPAGKRETVLKLKGVHPNTRDTVVLNYLAKFGKISNPRVQYGIFHEGPLKGMKNGDRLYKLEINMGENIGSYHIIDGNRVSIFYAGQQHTCGRCHKTSDYCKGGAIARKCEAHGGIKVDFKDYIRELWDRIGYSPQEDDLSHLENEIQQVEHFTPLKVQEFPVENFTGVCIKQFPRDMDHGNILEFLCTKGLPENEKESVDFKVNGSVIIDNLDNETVQTLYCDHHDMNKSIAWL